VTGAHERDELPDHLLGLALESLPERVAIALAIEPG